jgi:hypothetical protein
MGEVSKVYRQLLLPLPFNASRRQLRLNNIHKLYNYRVRKTGISQILNYFLDEDSMEVDFDYSDDEN